MAAAAAAASSAARICSACTRPAPSAPGLSSSPARRWRKRTSSRRAAAATLLGTESVPSPDTHGACRQAASAVARGGFSASSSAVRSTSVWHPHCAKVRARRPLLSSSREGGGWSGRPGSAASAGMGNGTCGSASMPSISGSSMKETCCAVASRAPRQASASSPWLSNAGASCITSVPKVAPMHRHSACSAPTWLCSAVEAAPTRSILASKYSTCCLKLCTSAALCARAALAPSTSARVVSRDRPASASRAFRRAVEPGEATPPPPSPAAPPHRRMAPATLSKRRCTAGAHMPQAWGGGGSGNSPPSPPPPVLSVSEMSSSACAIQANCAMTWPGP